MVDDEDKDKDAQKGAGDDKKPDARLQSQEEGNTDLEKDSKDSPESREQDSIPSDSPDIPADDLTEDYEEKEEATAPEELPKEASEEVPEDGGGEIVDELDRIAANQHDGVVISKGLSIETDKKKVKFLEIVQNFIKNIPPEVKAKSLYASGVLLTALLLVYFLVQGQLLPRFAFPYKVSYKELAQDVYTYPTDGLEVPLFDDSRSKAFTVALPKVTINLLEDGDGPSYGDFEFFLNLRDRDLITQVNSQERDVMEIVRRSLENISWNELQTPIGKDRVKKQIRSDLNKFLGGNMILSVYYRSVVLSR